MPRITPQLRNIVANGWNIQNRKSLNSSQRELLPLAIKSGLGPDVIEFSTTKPYLTPTNIPKVKLALMRILGLTKEKPQLRIKNAETSVSCCLKYKDRGGDIAFAYYPKDYTTTDNNGTTLLKPYYYIELLQSAYTGDGSKQIREVLLKSLKDKQTQGRIILECTKIERERPCAAGFYYKLGFRFSLPKPNEICEQWLKNGGTIDTAPNVSGEMYLPKKNILQCLTYGIVRS